MVDESPSDDNSVAILHPNTMEALGLFRCALSSFSHEIFQLTIGRRGDTVIGQYCRRRSRQLPTNKLTVRGKRRKDTVLICLSQDDIEEGKIAMNKGKHHLR